jgi:hypothetical protein
LEKTENWEFKMLKVIIPFQVMENARPTERDKFINNFDSIRVEDKREVFILTKAR